MSNTNKFLLAALVIQVLVALVIFVPNDDQPESSGGALLPDFAVENVSEVRITDADDQQLVLAKDDAGNWVLPERGNYPVNGENVAALLLKIQDAETNRLITRSNTSHRRLQVADDEFLRKIEIKSGDDTQVIYIGSSSGGNATHVRRADQDDVYLVGELGSQDANTQLTGWIETQYVSLPYNQVVGMRLENANGVFEFTKEGENWVMADVEEGEIFVQENFVSLLSQATTIRITEPLGTEAQDEYGLAEPQATIIITVAAPTEAATSPEATVEPAAEPETYTFRIGAQQENGVVIKADDSEYYALVAEFTASNFTGKQRTDFVTAPEPTPEPTLMSPFTTPSFESPVVEPTVEPTLEPTIEPTIEPTQEVTESPTEEATTEP